MHVRSRYERIRAALGTRIGDRRLRWIRRRGSRYRFAWATIPNDFVFAAGHRIGIILVANYTSFSSGAGATGSTVTLDTRVSKVRLPIIGGYGVAVASGRIRRQLMTLAR